MRPGLFQFEIGVQSTNPETLAEIDRPADVPRLLDRVRRLLEPGNIHVHLDLIAGLPYEDYERFRASFNTVYAQRPHQFQLGFLKVLSGSKMEKMAEAYGLAYSRSAPYEVLFTRWLGYGELGVLRGVAAMVDTYYNSFRFAHVIAYLLAFFPDPFSFYAALSSHFKAVTEGRPVSQTGYYDLLHSFARERGIDITEKMQWLAKYDLLLHEKPRKKPAWIAVDLSRGYREYIRRFFMDAEKIAAYLPEYAGETSLAIERTAHLEVFPFHPETGEEGAVAVVLNYRRRDVAGLARVWVLPVDVL